MKVCLQQITKVLFVVLCANFLFEKPAWSEQAGNGNGKEHPVKLYPVVKDGKWGYMDPAGKLVIEHQYKLAWDFHEGLACVGVGAFRGFIDKTGKMVIKPQFGWAGRFSNGVAVVSLNNGRYGDHIDWYKPKKGFAVIDKTGKILGKAHGRPCDFSDGISWAGKRAKYIDKTGKSLSFEGDEGTNFSEGLAAVRIGNQWGYIDRTMKITVSPKFSAARPFQEGLAPVATSKEPPPIKHGHFTQWLKKGGKLQWGYADKTGSMVVEPKFDDAWIFSEGMAAVCVDGKWGFINSSGAMVVIPEFDFAWTFSEGKGRVMKDGKQGFVDKNGKVVVALKFDTAWGFSNGLARVGVGEKEGYINHKGQYVWEPSQ